jgi:hypothetical protein
MARTDRENGCAAEPRRSGTRRIGATIVKIRRVVRRS